MWFARRQMLDCIIMFSAQDQHCPYGVSSIPIGEQNNSFARQIIQKWGKTNPSGDKTNPSGFKTTPSGDK